MNAKIIKQKQLLKAAHEKLVQIEELENKLPFSINKEKINEQIAGEEEKYAGHLQMLFETVADHLRIKIIEPV